MSRHGSACCLFRIALLVCLLTSGVAPHIDGATNATAAAAGAKEQPRAKQGNGAAPNAIFAQRAFGGAESTEMLRSAESNEKAAASNMLGQIALPVSFMYGGNRSADLVAKWKRETSEAVEGSGVTLKTLVLTDPATGLQVKAVARVYRDTPAVDWTVYFTNTGQANTPILESIRPLDVVLSPPAPDAKRDDWVYTQDANYVYDDEKLPVLSRIKGSVGCIHFSFDEFQPMFSTIRKGEKQVFGTSSSFDKYGPFFEVTWPGGGVVTGIGWTGEWTATVEGLENGRVHIDAGMKDLHTYLRPGETIRTPRIMQVYWTGAEPETGHNLFRQAMVHHVLPKLGGNPVVPPISALCPGENSTNQDLELNYIKEAMKGTGFEVYWLDAYWHKGGFPAGMGNYTFPIETAVDPVRFSRGMRPLSDAAHERGYKFLLWFAPEGIPPQSTMAKEHREWLLRPPDSKGGSFNLGLPEAREYMTRFMNACIKDWNINIWRTDAGLDLGHLKANEKDPDRLGIQEIRYFEGLYRFWDDLREQNPGLMIDNCCGGGTRLDLETCARSIPLWRTDSTVWTLGRHDENRLATVNQIINASLNRYMPASGGAVIAIEPYYTRSGFNGGMVLYDDLLKYKDRKGEINQAIKEYKRLRKYYYGDFYRLVYHSHDPREWCVYQYHLPQEDAGVIFAFRRDESPFKSSEVAVKGISPDTAYALTFYETYEPGKTVTMTGTEMQRLLIEIGPRPGSVLIEYRKAK